MLFARSSVAWFCTSIPDNQMFSIVMGIPLPLWSIYYWFLHDSRTFINTQSKSNTATRMI